MTLKQWSEMYKIPFFPSTLGTELVCVPYTQDVYSNHNADHHLHNLEDYQVSKVESGTLWLSPKTLHSPNAKLYLVFENMAYDANSIVGTPTTDQEYALQQGEKHAMEYGFKETPSVSTGEVRIVKAWSDKTGSMSITVEEWPLNLVK
jgi:hypothetical protein